MKNNQNVKIFLLLFSIFSLASVIVTFPLILRLNTGLYGAFFTTDIRGSVWSLWWTKYASSHHLSEGFCPFISVPYGVDLSQGPSFVLASSITKSLDILTTPLIALNVVTIFSFVLCGFFSYFLFFHLTKSRISSLILALGFTFSPYHLNKVAEFSYIFIADWLVLFVYCFIRLKEKQDFKNILFCSLSLGLVIAFNIYYAFFCLLFIFGFFIFAFFYQWKFKIHDFLKSSNSRFLAALKFLGAVLIVGLGSFLLNAAPLIKILGVFGSGNVSTTEKAQAGLVRSFDYLIAQSARPLSYLLPASTHPMFGSFTKSMFGSLFYGRGPVEQTLYLGWGVLFLSIWAFRQWKFKRLNLSLYPDYLSSKENFFIGFFLFSALFAFICSMPPVVNLGITKIYFPSYFFYQILPMLRAYARLGVVVMLSVCVLAAFGLKFILGKIRTKKIKIVFSALVLCVMMLEFTNVPPSRVADLTNIPEVYQWLRYQPAEVVVVEYPMAIAASGEAQENYDYMFYQTIHEKRLVNGAAQGTKGFDVKKKIAKIDAPETPDILRSLGTKIIVFHSGLYKTGEYREGVDVLGEVPHPERIKDYKLIQQFGDDYVYEILGD